MGRSRRSLMVGMALLAAVLAAGCQPITHLVTRVVEPVGGPVTLVTTSGSGRFAVVLATAPGATVPGPGWFRVDRTDGSVLALPAMSSFRAISTDGQRISYYDASGADRLWDAGTVKAVPFGVTLGGDLRFGAFQSLFSLDIRRWEVATDARVPVEAGHPRPADHTEVLTGGTIGVSPDGNVVWFQLTGTGGCLTRFIWLQQSVVRDLPRCTDVVVAASGASVLYRNGVFTQSPNPYVDVSGMAGFELVNTLTGATSGPVVPSVDGAWFDTVRLSADGSTVWAVATTAQGTFPPDCGGMGHPTCTGTLTARDLVAVSTSSVVHRTVDARLGGASTSYPSWSSTSADGRFFLYAVRADAAPVQVVDRVAGTDEVLAFGPGPASAPWISDDGHTVFHQGRPVGGSYGAATGWIEHEVAPPE